MSFKQRMMAIAVAGALGCAGSAFAAVSKTEMKTEKDRIAAEYKSAKAKCDGLKGNAKDVCMAEAKGMNKVAKAELEARDKDTPKARADVKTAKAEADYDVAKEKCDDQKGNAKDVCKKDAKAAFTAAKEDAKVEKTAGRSSEKVAEARQDAREEKRDANYAAAKERCDSMSGDAKDRCVADAKARFHVK
jgi:hypothetical protein